MTSNSIINKHTWITLTLIALSNISIFSHSAFGQSANDTSSGGLWYVAIFAILVSFGFGYYFWKKSSKTEDQSQYNYNNRYKNYNGSNESYYMSGFDNELKIDWLGTSKKSTPDQSSNKTGKNLRAGKNSLAVGTDGTTPRDDRGSSLDTKAFQEKMRLLQYSNLPINSFNELSNAKLYNPLPVSNDPSVIAAIEQANEEFEEDEAIRELAVRVLTAFRTRNSVDALSQIALYDLSSNLRSKAVSTLTDFDHESVFEPLLLACADPTREVRAAAARGLFRLNFDRADSWKRIIETNDEFRMSHAAKAAIESGIVVKSFDRLVHEDLKVAYEAFVLVALLIRSGETTEIFNAIKQHNDERVRFALLHVLKVIRDDRTMDDLNELKKTTGFSEKVSERILDTVLSIEAVIA